MEFIYKQVASHFSYLNWGVFKIGNEDRDSWFNVPGPHKVCSHCDANIPLDAEVCPECGQPWDTDEDFPLDPQEAVEIANLRAPELTSSGQEEAEVVEWYNRGMKLKKQQRLEYFQSGLQKEPKFHKFAYTGIAVSLLEQRDYEGASLNAAHGIVSDPLFGPAWYYLCAAQSLLGNLGEGKYCYREFKQLKWPRDLYFKGVGVSAVMLKHKRGNLATFSPNFPEVLAYVQRKNGTDQAPINRVVEKKLRREAEMKASGEQEENIAIPPAQESFSPVLGHITMCPICAASLPENAKICPICGFTVRKKGE